MTTARYLTFVGIGLGAAALGTGLAGGGAVWLAPAAAVGLLWLVGEWRGWGWVTTAAFTLQVSLAAAGIMMGSAAAWMGAAVVIGVCAWSLGDFVRRAAPLAREAERPSLERRFLTRLLILAGASLALGAIALTVRVRLSFLPAVLLGALLVYGLIRVIGVWREAGQ
jgi:hypothetical protein